MEELNKLVKKGKIVGILDQGVNMSEITLGTTCERALAVTGKSYKKICDSLKLVGLDKSILGMNTLNISNGERQKIIIAKKLLENEKVMIFQNPTAYLDSVSKSNLIKLIKLMDIRYGKNIIIISNDTDFMHKIANYVFIIDNGKIVFEGDKYSVFSNVELLEKYKIKMPLIMQFSDLVYINKKVKLGFRDNTDDLMKDIYRAVE